MPTAGEARLKSKLPKKTSKDRVSLKGKATSKTREVKRKTVPHHNSGNSSIPVPVKSGAKGKENTDPNVDPPAKINKKSSKVKQAPDFRKLHRKWEDQLAKGKAVSKKKNTTAEPFKLAENNQRSQKSKRPYTYNSEDEEDNVDNDDDDFEIDSTALKGILSETGIRDEDLQVAGRTTIAAIPSSKPEQSIQPDAGILKRNFIYYTRALPRHTAGTSFSKIWCMPRTSQAAVSPLQPRNVDVALKSQALSCTKKQVAWADKVSENDAFEFQPDSQALQSILRDTGITFNQMSVQNTGRVTLAGGRITPYRRACQSLRERRMWHGLNAKHLKI